MPDQVKFQFQQSPNFLSFIDYTTCDNPKLGNIGSLKSFLPGLKENRQSQLSSWRFLVRQGRSAPYQMKSKFQTEIYLFPHVVVTLNHPFVSCQFSQTHRSAGVQSLSRDGYFSAKPKLRAVCEPCAGVYIHCG